MALQPLGSINITGTKLSIAPVFHQEAQLRVLRFLWQNRVESSGREIAREVGLSAPSCHDALKKLYARRLVWLRVAGNVHLYKANEQNHLLQNYFARLFEVERSIPEEVVRLIRNSLLHGSPAGGILSIVLFGSMARGKGKLDSDMDLLVIAATKADLKAVEAGLEKLRHALSIRFGIALSPYLQALADIRRKHSQGLPLIHAILRDGQCLYGKELKDLLYDAKEN